MIPGETIQSGQVLLDFVYKGHRNYVTGADIYDAIVGVFRELAPETVKGAMSITMIKFARNQCILSYTEFSAPAPAYKPDNGIAYFTMGTYLKGWLIETGVPIQNRKEYNEKQLLEGATIVDNAISGYCNKGYEPIEVLVAMTKRLHEVLFPHEGKKWIFTKLELKRLLQENDPGGLQIELTGNMGTQITKSTVFSNSENIGNIYFSTQDP